MKIYDLIIIGAGPGGLAAALYAARYKMNVIVIGKMPGGTATMAHKICNYPGFEKITGLDLMNKIITQIKKLDVEIRLEEVINIKKEDDFLVKTNKKEYVGKKILISTGSQNVKLNLEKEDDFNGKGISYCATCDAQFYKDKVVGVVGGGNSALTAALLLSEFAKKVYIFYRQDSFFRAENVWVEEVERNEKIEAVFNSTISRLIGEKKLEGVEINKNEALFGVPQSPELESKKEEIKLDGLFVEIGRISNLKLANLLGIELDGDFIKVDKEQKTNVEGVFAAGDVTNNPLKQIITAGSEGAIVAFIAYRQIIKERKKSKS